jgi:hypothetical protein
MPFPRRPFIFAVVFAFPLAAAATQAKIDADTCTTLRLEQIKFRQSGILDDINKGANWAKANLTADRLRDIEHYLQLDEQVKFGCRDAKLSAEAQRASEAAARIEMNSDADPTALVAKDPPKPGSPADTAGDMKPAPKKVTKKKAKPSEAKKSGGKADKGDQSNAETAVPNPPVIVQSENPASAPSFAGNAGPQRSALPAFGFGEMTVSPNSAP